MINIYKDQTFKEIYIIFEFIIVMQNDIFLYKDSFPYKSRLKIFRFVMEY